MNAQALRNLSKALYELAELAIDDDFNDRLSEFPWPMSIDGMANEILRMAEKEEGL